MTGAPTWHTIISALPGLTTAKIIRSISFPTTFDQVAQMRRVIKRAIAGHPSLDLIVLVASELAANAVRHSGSAFFGLVILRVDEDGLRVAVIDEACSGFPRLQAHSVAAESGRGLQLVNSQVERWGIIRAAGAGSAIWFDIG